MIKEIRNTNNKGQYHGYRELSSNRDALIFRLNYKNNEEIGYQEWHIYKQTKYYIR